MKIRVGTKSSLNSQKDVSMCLYFIRILPTVLHDLLLIGYSTELFSMLTKSISTYIYVEFIRLNKIICMTISPTQVC